MFQRSDLGQVSSEHSVPVQTIVIWILYTEGLEECTQTQ